MKIRAVIPVWKPTSWTPLRVVDEFKKQNPLYAEEIISYAGRLDPMAEGILLLLVGEENKNRKIYEDLDKTYESEIVIGVSTDSFDALGIIKSVMQECLLTEEKINHILNSSVGKQKQLYPPYSSKAVKGKSLFWWARKDRLSEIKIPQRDIEIFSAKLLEFTSLSAAGLVKEIVARVSLINGDFRQEKIIEEWKKFGKLNENKFFYKIKINVKCSSGTYIRRIASNIGNELRLGAFALTIKRISVGEFNQDNCIYLKVSQEEKFPDS